MKEFGILIISAFLSTAIFSLLFYWLNSSRLGLFKPIENKIDVLNKEKKRKLRVIINIIGILIAFILPIFNLNIAIIGLILGFLMSLIEICFRSVQSVLRNENKD